MLPDKQLKAYNAFYDSARSNDIRKRQKYLLISHK